MKTYRPPRTLRLNRPPAGVPWIWLTRDILESDAFMSLRRPAVFVLFRIILEHMAHGGTENGNLQVTYNQFEEYSISRKSVHAALLALDAVGLIDLVVKGQRSHGIARRPSRYGLTWLPRNDGTPASNRWRRFKKG